MSQAPQWIGPEDLRQALPIADAVAALERALRQPELPAAPHRILQAYGDAVLVCMPAAGGTAGAGVKLLTAHPGNPSRGLPFVQGAFVLFEPDTLAPLAILDGGALTRLRAPAVTATATKRLAREDARVLVVFGAGTQALAHVEAMRTVRPIERVHLVGRDRERTRAAVETLRSEGVDARVGGPGDVAQADVVCTCTTAGEPLFDGAMLRHGAHVNAIGAYEPDRRELDTETVLRGHVVVEDREAVLGEAGDLLIPIGDGSFSAERIAADLAELVRGKRVRQDEADVTVFKSVGAAYEDLIVASAVASAA